MSDKRSTQVAVTNHFGGRANITLHHRFGDEPPEVKTWEGLTGGQSGEPLTVHYETGLFTGFDRWSVRVEVVEGPQKGVYETADAKRCYLTEDDQGTVLTFDVSAEAGFKINLISSSCQADLVKSA
ncbi:hypothetical protein GCM10009841_19910 [Microlunatus panaciterrae]|uniref:Up-regulated in Daf-2 domain-containing protein n=1 Tax=Microlunatus panaciterrae TaxID=400768 RepID=A0ABS2RNF8_9ACTN|nr:hypothetical protein [Microlunatus panaciterrae]MBM7800544.1 hypothetical protein [Microlunatus panaciterrae]